jgi:ABC-type branched-subunit amino acid transport system ATPase component
LTREAASNNATLLRVQDLTVTFGGLTAVAAVSFEVRAGTVFGMIGPNGSGKTTLINAISGLQNLKTGRVEFDGVDITKASPAARGRLGVARTYQHIRLFPGMTAFENVAVGADAKTRRRLRSLVQPRRARGARTTRAADLHEVMELLDVASVRSAMATALPYGVQRRVEIARAIAGNPTLLLLDEPTAGMSAAETRAIGEVVRGLRTRGIAVVLIEHDVDWLLELADEVMALNFGRSVAYGIPQEVRSSPAVIESYLGVDA